MPHAGFPIFGEHDQLYRAGTLANENDYAPDPRDVARAWAAAALVIAVVFIVLIVAVPREPRASTADLMPTLPANSRSMIPALVQSTGSACLRLCGVAADRLRAGSIVIACSRDASVAECADPVRYELSVAESGS